jgi:hypothetical protein
MCGEGHHTKAINSMSDKDLDLKAKTEQRQRRPWKFGMREGYMNVASIFTLGIGEGTKQDGRKAQQA